MLMVLVSFLSHSQQICQSSVLDRFYLLSMDTMDVIACQHDYYQHVQFKCHSCHGLIMNDAFCVIGDYKYHKQCLQCPGCTISNNSDAMSHQQLYRYNDRPYCRYHYSLIRGTECMGCGQTVLEQNEALENWHTECYMLKRYYHVALADLQLPYDYSSRQQLEHTQDSFENLRYKLWHITSQFEEEATRILSSLAMARPPDQLLLACQSLLAHLSILFSVLDLLFVHATHVSYIKQVQSLTQHVVFMLDATAASANEEASTDDKAPAMASRVATHIRHLVRLGLQQAMILVIIS